MAVEVDELTRIREIFFPYADRRSKLIESNGQRFVHYTSAAVAASIITNKKIWMRNAATMNDFSEVDYGIDRLRAAYVGPSGRALMAAVGKAFPDVGAKVESHFNGWISTMRTQTYITCLSEHLDSEDECGRLSMWRAYGGTTGVALVVRSNVFFSKSTALGAFSNPVLYSSQPQFDALMANVAENISREIDYLKTLGEAHLAGALFLVFRIAALCTKHPGFEEEREWRVIHNPEMDITTHLERSIETVRGTPQRVYKIPLQDIPEDGLFGLEPNALLDRVIIGPTEHPNEMAIAFEDLLAAAGVDSPEQRVFISHIPLRYS